MTGDLVFVGDVHLGLGDPEVEAFTSFLEAIAPTTVRLVLVGDLFNLWLGRRELERPHQRFVTAKLATLRRQGIVVRYLEGNRDFRLGPAYAGSVLDDVAGSGILERQGGKRLYAIHGDLANRKDFQYRAWRRIARSRLAWTVFNSLPRDRRLRLAEAVEARMRRTNTAHKRAFPEQDVRAYAARFLRAGHDAVVLGHFHIEKDLQAEPPSPPGRVLVLPEWKTSRRHLQVNPRGEIRFVDSPS